MYARRGVREAWLVDLSAEVVEVYREPEADEYRSVERAGRGGTLVPQVFPDVAGPVDEILPGAAET